MRVPTVLAGLSRLQWWLAGLLALGIVMHAVQFPFLESAAKERTRAVMRSESGDLYALALAIDESSWTRNNFALALAEIAPGSTYYAASEIPASFNRRILGFGQAAEYNFLDVESGDVVDDAFDPAPYVVAAGEGGPRTDRWLVAIEPGSSLGDADAPDDFLRELLDADARRQNAGGPPREFYLVRVPTPGPVAAGERGYTLLCVETSLLGGLPEGASS